MRVVEAPDDSIFPVKVERREFSTATRVDDDRQRIFHRAENLTTQGIAPRRPPEERRASDPCPNRKQSTVARAREICEASHGWSATRIKNWEKRT